MATITQYFEQAQLSLAAYALDLQSGMFGSADANYISKLKAAGMSDTQAIDFANTYTVIDQFTDSASILDSGFSATLFKDNRTQQIYLAIRGTEPLTLADIGADLNLATGSLAGMQLIAIKTKGTGVDFFLMN
jgi:hypothetical protein